MSIVVPSPAALERALSAGLVPPAAARRPVRWAADEQGRLWLRPSTSLPAAALTALQRFGFAANGTGPRPPEEAANWFQLLPLRRGAEADLPAVVVLAFADPALLPLVAAELVRLGAP